MKKEYDFSAKNRVIFTITTVRDPKKGGSRCVGFYFGLTEAVEAVKGNYGDIYEEGYYPYCVIESVKQGIYYVDRREFWFKWDNEMGRYRSIPKKPDELENIVCFGIG